MTISSATKQNIGQVFTTINEPKGTRFMKVINGVLHRFDRGDWIKVHFFRDDERERTDWEFCNSEEMISVI